MIDVWAKVPWQKEACDAPPDPNSGAAITRLSGSALFTINNYYAGGCSPDGTRVVAVRFADLLVNRTYGLLALDVETKWAALLDPALATFPYALPFSGIYYYINRDGAVCRASLQTFETQVLLACPDMPPLEEVRAVTADHRYLFGMAPVPIAEGMSVAIVRIDLEKQSWTLPYENPGIHGFYLSPDGRMLYVGHRVQPDGSTPPVGRWKNAEGVQYRADLLDLDGKFVRTVGTPPGYSHFLGDTGRAVCDCAWDRVRHAHLPERPQGNMVIFQGWDWKQERVIEAPEHLFWHIAGSKCGRYVVTDAQKPGLGPAGPISIVVVNIETGKHRTLVEDCGSRSGGGGLACRQPTPYFTTHNRHVIYNADPDGFVNVYAARIPDGFLESLE